jgi:hypothetical protein
VLGLTLLFGLPAQPAAQDGGAAERIIRVARVAEATSSLARDGIERIPPRQKNDEEP